MAKQEIGDLEEIRQKLEGWLASRIPNVEDFTLGELNFPEFSGESSVTLIMEANWQEAGRARHERFVLRMAPIIFMIFMSRKFEIADSLTWDGVIRVLLPGCYCTEC